MKILLKKIPFLTLTILLSVTSSALAEDLQEAYDYAVANDPTVQAAYAAYQANRQAIGKGVAKLLPTLSGNLTTTGINSGLPFQGKYNSHSYSLSLTQPLFRLENWTTLGQAFHFVAQSEATYLAEKQNLISRTSERYFAILGAKDDLQFSKSQRKAFARRLEQTQQRFDVGLIAITEVHEAQARLDRAIASEIEAKNNLANEFEKLREITNIPIFDVATMIPDDAWELTPPNPNNQETWVNTAHQYNLNLQIAQNAAKVAHREITTQLSGHFPKVDLKGDLQKGNSTPPLDKRDFTSKNISLTAAIPFFEGGGTIFRTKEARARYDEALKNLERAQRTTESEARQAYRGVLTQISQVKSLAQAIISSESALKSIRASYDVGTRTIVDVLDAETNLLNAQRDHAKSKYGYILEGLRLKQAAGTLNEEDILQTNTLLQQTK